MYIWYIVCTNTYKLGIINIIIYFVILYMDFIVIHHYNNRHYYTVIVVIATQQCHNNYAIPTGLSRLQSSLHHIDGMGVINSSVIYGSLVLSCLFLPKMVSFAS